MRPATQAEARDASLLDPPFGVKLPETFFVREGLFYDGLWSTHRCAADYESGCFDSPFCESLNQGIHWCLGVTRPCPRCRRHSLRCRALGLAMGGAAGEESGADGAGRASAATRVTARLARAVQDEDAGELEEACLAAEEVALRFVADFVQPWDLCNYGDFWAPSGGRVVPLQ